VHLLDKYNKTYKITVQTSKSCSSYLFHW